LISVEKDGEIHLYMIDSNLKKEIDSLKTDVKPGDKIIWRYDDLSGIDEVTSIKPKEGGPKNIFRNDPTKRLLGPGYKLRVPKDIREGLPPDSDSTLQEEYYIDYIHRGGRHKLIDPYIRVPPEY
jgi:hypothetical protein